MIPHTIRIFPGAEMIGTFVEMSFSENLTVPLWRSFVPKINSISGRIGSDLYSLEIFPPDYFEIFSAVRVFEKWAAVPVTAGAEVPEDLLPLHIPEGTYAVFIHYGPASKGHETYQAIFTEWLPQSGYQLDTRPHFAIMGERYQHEEDSSEEEIWIPVKEAAPPV